MFGSIGQSIKNFATGRYNSAKNLGTGAIDELTDLKNFGLNNKNSKGKTLKQSRINANRSMKKEAAKEKNKGLISDMDRSMMDHPHLNAYATSSMSSLAQSGSMLGAAVGAGTAYYNDESVLGGALAGGMMGYGAGQAGSLPSQYKKQTSHLNKHKEALRRQK